MVGGTPAMEASIFSRLDTGHGNEYLGRCLTDALSNDAIQVYDFKSENLGWTKITIARIAVNNGKVEIGFSASGIANAFCYVDDVSLVKVK